MKADGSSIDQQVNQLAVRMLVVAGPTALEPFVGESRFERMAQELEFAIRNTSGADLAKLAGLLASDTGTALSRRITGLLGLLGKLARGTVDELGGMRNAYANSELAEHLGGRIGTAAGITTRALSSGVESLSAIARDLAKNPAEAGPKLLVLVLTSVATSGGVDGNGGAPDLDIPLMGIGEHRSPLTHSILIGTLLEASLILLTRLVLCTHKNLPANHDPLWDGLARQSVGVLNAAGKGASIGIAYHLMVDAVVQPGAYHGIPFDMPLEAHLAIFAANAVAEATAVKAYPDEEAVTATPKILAAHKNYRASPMQLPAAVEELLTPTEILILRKYGTWLDALAKRLIPPTTLAQVQFLKVADRRSAPVTEHEEAWLALAEARQVAEWVSKKPA